MGSLKFLKRDKNSILKSALIPIISIIGICFIFSKIYVQNIPFGIVDLNNSTLSQNIIQQLKNNPGLKISYYTDSENNLEESIKEKKVSGGIIIPKDFNKKAVEMKSPSILLLIDGSNMVIGNNILGYVSTVLGTINAGFQLNVLQRNNMLPYTAEQTLLSFSFSERILYEPQLSYMKYLVYTIMPLTVQLFFFADFLVPLLIKEKSRFALIKTHSKQGLKDIAILSARILIIMGIFIVSSFIGLCAVDKLFGVPMRGSILTYFILMFIFLINLTAMGLIFSSIIENPIYFVEIYGMVYISIMLTSGVPWPEYMMPKPLVMAVQNLWPFMDVALPLKYLNLKGIGWNIIFPYIKNGLYYTLFWLPVGILSYSTSIIFKKHRNKKKSYKGLSAS